MSQTNIPTFILHYHFFYFNFFLNTYIKYKLLMAYFIMLKYLPISPQSRNMKDTPRHVC